MVITKIKKFVLKHMPPNHKKKNAIPYCFVSPYVPIPGSQI